MVSSSPVPACPVEVFFSYAHRDETLRDELAKHLSLLQNQKVIAGWYDRQIPAGTEWAGAIDAHHLVAGIQSERRALGAAGRNQLHLSALDLAPQR